MTALAFLAACGCCGRRKRIDVAPARDEVWPTGSPSWICAGCGNRQFALAPRHVGEVALGSSGFQ